MSTLSTIAAFGFADFNPPTLLPIYRRLGCASAQFYRNTKNPPAARDARNIANDAGTPIDSIHGVFGPEFDPSAPDEATRRAAVETYKAEGELALSLGGPFVVVHPAPPAKDVSLITPETINARYARLKKSMEELAALGEKQGVVYLIENIPPNYEIGSDVAKIAALIRQVKHPNLRMCFDTGHAHMVGSAAVALEHCHDVVSYFHVHDNDGRTDSHEIPGKGSLPWENLGWCMKRLAVKAPAMLELFQSEPTLEGEIASGLPKNLRRWLALA